MKRRAFLKKSSVLALGSALSGGITMVSAPQKAHAEDYKALVCVFLLGGMDNHDTVIPYDTSSYEQWASVRSSLLAQYGGKRDRTNLLPLQGEQFALPPELTGLHGLIQSGNGAVIGNVGPLIQPATRAEFEAGSLIFPPMLFSHNDQQAVWMSSSPEGAQFGWGGFFADALLAGNTGAEFTGITTGDNELFLTGSTAQPYQIDSGGAARIFKLDEFEGDLRARLRSHFRAEQYTRQNVIGQDLANAMAASVDSNEKFDASVQGATALSTNFPSGGISARLRSVAQAISARQSLGVSRQIFIVGMGGYDTHSARATSLPGLHTSLDGGIVAFQQAMQELGLANQVTLFTASDFGRTLAINGDGTDHGWGAHHFVVGGAVNGNQIIGDIPPPTFEHSQDAGGGRLIPTISVEQYAGALGQWLGLTSEQIQNALPNTTNFAPLPGTLFT